MVAKITQTNTFDESLVLEIENGGKCYEGWNFYVLELESTIGSFLAMSL